MLNDSIIQFTGLDGAARDGILAQLAPGPGLWTSLYSSCWELIDAAPGLGTVLCGVGGWLSCCCCCCCCCGCGGGCCCCCWWEKGGWCGDGPVVIDPVSLRERGVNDGVEASSPEAADVLDSVDCCDASSNPAPSGPVMTILVTGEADEGGWPSNHWIH